MEEQCKIDRLRNPRPVKLLVAVEAGLVEAYHDGFHDTFLYLPYGRGGILLGLINPVHKGTLTD